MGTIANNLAQVMRRVTTASQKKSDSASVPLLLAVSKGQTNTAIEAAYAAGQHDFGENYLQEALAKIQALQQVPDICWHFIGPIQSNKTRQIAENFAWVHTLDRLKIASRLSEQRPPEMPPLNVCIQVNIDRDPNKSGVLEKEVRELALEIVNLPHLKLRGLMTIPRQPENQHDAATPFIQLRQLFNELRNSESSLSHMDTLSMGMSADLETAIAAGSTLVRVGTAIFGERSGQKLSME